MLTGEDKHSSPDAESDQVVRPWRSALRNSAAAIVPIGIGGLQHLHQFNGVRANTAWWVWFVVAAGVVAICFGHAALGLLIGYRRSDSVFKLFLAAASFAGIYWLRNVLDGRGMTHR